MYRPSVRKEKLMKRTPLTIRNLIVVFAALALPVHLAGQHKYIFTEVPTFGGPNIYANQTGARNELLNAAGALTGGADTTITDPYCSNSPDCFAEHAFIFRNGILADLGVLLGGFNSQAFWINDEEVAVGFSQIGVTDPLNGNLQELRGTVWHNGRITTIATFGGNDSMAQGVNNREQVVGFALNPIADSMAPLPWPTEMRAFLWDDGVLQNLGTLGGPDSWAFFINDRGQVVGISYPDSNPSSVCDTPGNNHVFLWEKDQMQDIGTLGGSCSWPEGLSEQGGIVGWSTLAGDFMTHPFLWDRGTLTDLGTLGGPAGFGTSVNDKGEVVGGTDTEDGGFLAFIWRQGVMTPLRPLPGDCFSIAIRINSKDQILGTSVSCDGSTGRGVMWENGSVTDLNSFVPPESGFLITGDDLFLDNRGEISGNGVLPNGDIRFFTLTSVSGNDGVSASAVVQSSHQSPTAVTHGRITAEIVARLHARRRPHYHIPGLPVRN
jgi:probable HAF family extracellular repeat protein